MLDVGNRGFLSLFISSSSVFWYVFLEFFFSEIISFFEKFASVFVNWIVF